MWGEERMSTRWRDLLRRWHPEGIPWPGTVFYNAISRTEVFRRHYELVAEHVTWYCRAGRILDIGTGPGWLLITLRQLLPAVELAGVDISPGMAAAAQRNMAREAAGGAIEVKVAAAEALPFPDNSFHAVISTGSLHHWKHPVAALNEAYRVLRVGGYALVYDLVRNLPPAVAESSRRQFGAMRSRLMWLHSFEEPFYSPREMEALAPLTLFQKGEIQFVGALCCLVLRKSAAPAADARADLPIGREVA
jgi:SAM-dependent methyltransferase